MTDVLSLIDIVRLGAAGLIIAVGLSLMLGGGIGVMRFPDFYTRMHAAGAADATGAVIVVLGLALGAWDWRVGVKLVLLAALIGLVTPVTMQLLANAAHAGGLAPLAGRYVAPRPGAARVDGER